MNKINGNTRICGVFGNPVEHTMSPAIHNFLAERTGQNLVYVPFHVERGHLSEAVKGTHAMNILGINVTVPFKTEVMDSLCEIDSMAKKIGAVNTLVPIQGGFKGYNTDMQGLYKAMCEDQVKISDEKVLILGAGGVARAVAILLAEKNAKEIIIINRTEEKAKNLAEEVNAFYPNVHIRALALSDIASLYGNEKYLAIQATNIGMYPNIDDAVVMEESFYQHIHTGYDLVFNPLDTKFMQLVQQNKGRGFNGLKMLVYQGILSYEMWTGCAISDALAKEAYSFVLQYAKENG